jgi:hypothetical protein
MFADESLIDREKKQKRRLGVAIGWLTEQNQPHDIKQIKEASQRFNLSSPDEDFLILQFIHQRSI